VFAVDVGRGQLDWTLRNDPRVDVLEGINARHLDPGHLPARPSLAVVDVSFISLRLVLPAVAGCLARPGEIVALVKPQFEAGRESVGRGGIVRDPAIHRRVLERLAELGDHHGWGIRDVCAAAIRGARGNQEYFIHLDPFGAGLSATDRSARILTATGMRSGADA
jgi:23S rRNA (cytidine1920-2'-O)/16S rRNA (cytidine1409-2'-O)-methyltransferase